MSAEDVAQDAQQLAKILRQNLQKGEPAVQLKVPLSAYLDALDNLDKDELLLLRRRTSWPCKPMVSGRSVFAAHTATP